MTFHQLKYQNALMSLFRQQTQGLKCKVINKTNAKYENGSPMYLLLRNGLTSQQEICWIGLSWIQSYNINNINKFIDMTSIRKNKVHIFIFVCKKDFIDSSIFFLLLFLQLDLESFWVGLVFALNTKCHFFSRRNSSLKSPTKAARTSA